MTPKVEVLMLGGRGFGKTCFVLGMYNVMGCGVNDFMLTSSDISQRALLSQMWDDLATGTCPNGTLEGTELQFDCFGIGFDPLPPVTWFDYPGGWLDPSQRDNYLEHYPELLAKVGTADLVVCCVPADQLLMAHRTRRQLQCFKQYNTLFMDHATKRTGRNPYVMYVITKADLNANLDEFVAAADFMLSLAPFKSRGWPDVKVVPVSLGMGIDIREAQITSIDTLSPVNMHLPVLYAIERKLAPLLQDAVSGLDKSESAVRDKRSEIRAMSEWLLFKWLNSSAISARESSVSAHERTQKELSSKCEELTRQLEQVRQELARAKPLTYRDGVRLAEATV